MTDWMDGRSGFATLWEVEPATRPELEPVRRQVSAVGDVADAFLAPDNQLGHPAVSSVVVAATVIAAGGTAVACLNSRDRNELGFRRDLLTCSASGITDLLFVRGDDPPGQARLGGLSVRKMIEVARSFGDPPGDRRGRFRVGATIRPHGGVPDWKCATDFLLVQVGFNVDALLAWKEAAGPGYRGKVFAGVLVLASAGMARRLAGLATGIDIPPALIEQLDTDPGAGVEAAVEMVEKIRVSGAFDGVHLVPLGHYPHVAERLRRR